MRRDQLGLFLRLNKCKDSLEAEFGSYKGKEELDLALMRLDVLAGSVRIAPRYEAVVAGTCQHAHDLCDAAVRLYASELASVSAGAMHLLKAANASRKPWLQLHGRFIVAKDGIEKALRLVSRVSWIIQKNIDSVYSGVSREDHAAVTASPSVH